MSTASTTVPERPGPESPLPASSLKNGESASRKVKNTIFTALVWLAFLVALIPLGWILWEVLSKGLTTMLKPSWWSGDQSAVGPAGFDHDVHGAGHAIIGTLLMALATSIIAIPVAIMTAIYLVEYGRGPVARAVSFMVDILSGVPSIVAALFIYAAWVTTFHWKLLPICASLALVLLMIPVVTRSTEEMLKIVPNELREASYALGVPKWKTITKIVLPTSASGIITGSLLGFARVAGETAPLLILAAYTQYMNWNLFNGNLGMAALPTLINVNIGYLSDPTSSDRAWGAACTLIVIVLAINLLGRLLGRLTAVKK